MKITRRKITANKNCDLENHSIHSCGDVISEGCNDEQGDDTIEAMSVPVDFLDEADKTYSTDDVLSFLKSQGYDTSDEGVKNYADAVAEYMGMIQMTPSGGDYNLKQWYKDTKSNYPQELDELAKVAAACNTANIMSVSNLDLTEDQIDKLYEIADRYNTSDPVSGDWDDETTHEQQAIADEFDISLEEAGQLMINYLGFPKEDVVTAAADDMYDKVTYEVVEASEDTDSDDDDLTGPLDAEESKFLDSIEKTLDKWSKEESADNIESIVFDRDDDRQGNLYVTITLKGDDNGDVSIHDYTVPYEDLSFDFDKVENDAGYVMKAITEDIPDAVESATTLTDYDDLDDWEMTTEWEEIAHKTVPDSDGFYTDYTMYKYIGDPADVDDDIYVCIFGDQDLYNPENDYPDFSTSNESEAWEWFESYNGFDDNWED